MPETPFGYISPIGPALIQPLVKLVETLMAEPAKAPNDVQTSRNENGYSAAIIILAALVFESGIAGARYHERDTGRKSALGYFLEVTPESPLTRAIREVFVIRDVLAPGHISGKARLFRRRSRRCSLCPHRLSRQATAI